MFLSHEPRHWCAHPQLEELAPHLNLTQRLDLASPLVRQEGDLRLYSKCTMYNVSWSEVLEVRRVQFRVLFSAADD